MTAEGEKEFCKKLFYFDLRKYYQYILCYMYSLLFLMSFINFVEAA